MKTIKLDSLAQEFNVHFIENLYPLLLAEKSIAESLPDLSQWDGKNLADENCNIKTKHLQKALARYFENQKTAFQLNDQDLKSLAQHLVVICHFHAKLQIFNQNLLLETDLQTALLQFVDARGIVPPTFAEEYLLPVTIASLKRFMREDISRVLTTIDRMVQHVDVVAKHDDSGIQSARECTLANLEMATTYLPDSLIYSRATKMRSQSLRASNQLPGSGQFEEAGRKWVEKIIDILKGMLDNKEATNLVHFTFELAPHRVDEYVKLQNEIAKLIPLEYNRPTIIIRFRGKSRAKDENPDLGLLGGMGPLSDAQIVSKMLRKDKDQPHANVLLISSPSARDEEKAENEQKYNAHKAFRMSLLHYLRGTNCNKYAMLSNTAHLHRAGFKFITGDVISIILGSGTGKFINSVKEIAAKIKAIPAPEGAAKKIMILGTSEAAQGDLYFSRLHPEDVHYQFGKPTPTLAEKLPDEQIRLQEFINKAKESDEEARKIAFDFYQNLSAWVLQHQPTHVLLACTEIPILMSCTLPNTKTVQKALKDALGDKCPIIIDSEEEMIAVLDNERNKQELESPVGKLHARVNELTVKISNEESVNPDQIAVLIAISEALNMDNHQDAIRHLDEAIAGHPKFKFVQTVAAKVQPWLFQETAADSGYGWFSTRIVGTTSKQNGAVLSDLVYAVKGYLSNFVTETAATSATPAK